MRCWGVLESLDLTMVHRFVHILWERVRLALTMLDEKFGRVLIRCSWWHVIKATVQRGGDFAKEEGFPTNE